MTKTLAIVLMAFSCVLSASAVGKNGRTSDTRFIRAGCSDAAKRILTAIGEIRSAGGGEIVLEKGDYLLGSPVAMDFHVSNHDTPRPRNVFLPVTNVHDLVIRSEGARLLADGEGSVLALVDTSNVRIEGVVCDYVRPYFSEWTVRGGRLETEAERYPYVVEDGRIVSISNGWRQPQKLLAFFDGSTRRYLATQWWDGRADADFGGYPDGTVVLMRNGYRPAPCVCLYRAHNTSFDRCGALAAPGMGLLAQRCENVTIRRWHTRETRATALQADATHFSNCRGRITVEDSRFEGMVDDAINVHSTDLKIVGRKGSDTIVCQFMHSQSVGFEVFRPGETLRFIRAVTLEPGAEVKVRDVRILAVDRIEIVLTSDVPQGYGVGDAVENADWQPSVVFRRNIVRNCAPRAILACTPKAVVIEDNLFENVARQVLSLGGDARDWYESGACRDLVFRRNTVRNCAYAKGSPAVFLIAPAVHDLPAQKERYHRNIWIEDNLIEGFAVPLLKAKSASDVTICRNRILDGNERTVLEGCENVRVEGNELTQRGGRL